jgi:SAM-dependent methyltransferase
VNRLHRWLCRSSLWKYALEQKLLPWALEGIDLGDNVLEIGPGPGLATDLLLQRTPKLTALEIDRRLADSLKRRMTGTNVTVVEGDATRMPFADGSFSTVLAFTMLHHVPSVALQDQLLAEAHRVLRTGGPFIGTDGTVSLGFRMIHLWDTMVPVDPDGFGGRLRDAGFGGVSVDKRWRSFRFRAVRPQ